MARHNVERATGKPSCSNPRRILSYDTPQIIFWNAAKASSLGPKCTVPTSNAFEISSGCWPRTRRPHLGSGHDPHELPGLGFGRNVDLVQIDAPFRSYLTSARALLSLEGPGTGIGRPAARLDPGAGLGEGCGLALSAPDSRARSLCVPSTDSLRYSCVQPVRPVRELSRGGRFCPAPTPVRAYGPCRACGSCWHRHSF